MLRDLFYQQIIDGLNRPLVGEVFERCAQYLLRDIYPSLVPIRGGNDGGMDGITADMDDGPIVLVATVQKDVRANLVRSLESISKDGNTYRRIISATSRSLTPQRQQKLRATAEEHGFKIVQICEQAEMARLLYDSPEWCLELLNLVGDPSPLSVIPLSGRPCLTSALIGREDDAKWLSEYTGNRLLVGQPGMGKTFLLSSLAEKNGWLFARTDSLSRILDGIRKQDPKAIIVDDAHSDMRFLQELRRLLEESSCEIPIIATCWPGALDEIQECLCLTNKHVCTLDLLSRPEMNAILEDAGLTEPNSLVYEILNQAEGRPGLAVTLAHACLQGNESDLRNVFLGKSLIRFVKNSFSRLTGSYAREVLASFSVGGDAGMKMEDVANFLEESRVTISKEVEALSVGGVIHEVSATCLSVRPPELRFALIREVFFAGAKSLPINPLIESAPSAEHAVGTLIGARVFGADVPNELIRPLLDKSRSIRVWQDYAGLGAAETAYALERNPDWVVHLARPALNHLPSLVIPLLFEEAVGDTRAIGSNFDHPLGVIKEWVEGAIRLSSDAVKRRALLIKIVELWISSGKDVAVGLKAAAIALSPRFENRSIDPVLGDKWTLYFGLLPLHELQEVANLWPRFQRMIQTTAPNDWVPIFDAVENWAYPQRHVRSEVPDDVYPWMRNQAKQMLEEVSPMIPATQGIMRKAERIADYLEMKLDFGVDPDFEVFYPKEPPVSHEAHLEKVREVAERWANEPPKVVIDRVLQFQREAEMGGPSMCYAGIFADELARRVKAPLEWIGVILENDGPSVLLAALLFESSRLRSSGWEATAIRCLAHESLCATSVFPLLAMADPPKVVFDEALKHLKGMGTNIQFWCRQNYIPEATVREAFAHDDDEIASNAAIGFWFAEPEGSVPMSLREPWKKAILRGSRDEFWLGKILEADADLAFEYLLQEIKTNKHAWSCHNDALREALKSINEEHRRQLMAQLPDDFSASYAIQALVGESVELYQELLSIPRLKHLHLAPLEKEPTQGNWTEKAKAVLQAGIGTEEIAAAAFYSDSSWWGKDSDRWQKWIEIFKPFLADEDARIVEVAEHGIEMAKARYAKALQQERAEETYRRP